MKIFLKNRRFYIHLGLGIGWAIIGLGKILDGKNSGWYGYLFLLVALLYIGHFLYDLYNPYLKIENGSIKKNILYGKTLRNKLNINEIDEIKRLGGDYMLTAKMKKLRINTSLIKEESLLELEKFLRNLNLPIDKTPFNEVQNKEIM